MSDVNKQLLDAVKHCHEIFDQYVSHHLAKPDYDKAAANERHRAICVEAIAAAEAAQQAEPVAAQCRFEGEEEWSPCTLAHHLLVQAHPKEWPHYETRALYAQPPAVAVPEGYVLVPVEPTPKMLVAINWPNDSSGYRAMLAAAPKL